MPLNGPDLNGAPATLPQFNLSPSGHREAPDKEDMDIEAEEMDTMGDMPDSVEPLQSFTRQPAGVRMHSLTHSATRLGRFNSSMRAASSLQKSFSNMNSSGGHSQFQAQRSSVLQRLTSETGRDAGKTMVTSASFEDAVVQRIGSNVFAQRLFESQNPEGALEVPAERLVDALLTLEHASLEDHLRITFELLDTRGDGSIALENLEEILRVAFAKLKIPVTDRQLGRVAEALFKDIKAARDTTEVQGGGLDEEEALQQSKMARINSGMVTESVRFDELVRLLKNHIEDMEKHHHRTRKTVVTLQVRARKLMYRILGIRHLLFWFCFWVGMALSFFAGYYLNYRNPLAHVSGAAYPLAKAFAQVIQPLSFLLLFAVCRRTITALRETLLHYVFPFDESISFHRLCGYLLLICSAGHTICHIGNYTTWASGGTSSHNWVKTFGTNPPTAISLWGNETSITGYIMWFSLLIGYFFAMWYPRKAKKIEKTAVGRVLNNFTYFSISHIAMWFIFYVALILHPLPGTPSQHKNHHSTTWIYVALPFVLYVAERVWRLIRNVAFKGELLDVELLPGRSGGARGGVVVLRVRRPRDFSYRPGMYMFINIPGISVMEWHPFTITSAPGDPYVSVHVRDAGDWTHALYEYMANYAQSVEADLPPLPKGEALRLATFKDMGTNPGKGLGAMGGMSLARSMTLSHAVHGGKQAPWNGSAKSTASTPRMVARQGTFVPGAAQGLTPTLQRRRTRASLRACTWDPLPDAPLVLLDGPYSAPAMRWEDYEVLVLVGAGIGVTPFASVLADMVNKLESNVCEECGHMGHAHAASGVNVEKIYFHWVVGDTSAPNYFASTLETISSDDQLGLVEPRIHLTAVKPSTEEGPDLHSIFVKLGQEALHRQQGIDVVIGLKSKVVTQFGRPNWPRIVADVADNHPGQTVGVFVCGPPPFTKAIKHACEDFNASATTRIKVIDEEVGADLEAGEPALKKTVFDFYEEYF